MNEFLLILIFITAALSLLSYIYCWHEVKSGRPHIIALRQITEIMDRNRLNQMFGNPEPGYYYPLSPDALQKLMRWRRIYVFAECAADIACLAGAYYYMKTDSESPAAFGFIVLAALCQGINIGYTLHLVRKWSSQLREEMDDLDD